MQHYKALYSIQLATVHSILLDAAHLTGADGAESSTHPEQHLCGMTVPVSAPSLAPQTLH